VHQSRHSSQQVSRAGYGYTHVVHDRDHNKTEHYACDHSFQESGKQLSRECRNGSNNSSHSHSLIPQNQSVG